MNITGGPHLLRPSTHTQAKYHKPHSLGENPQTAGLWTGHQGAAWHWPPVSRNSGRWVTTGATMGGRQLNEKRTERRQEEEREMHAQQNYLETLSSGKGISEVGERGEQIHQWKKWHIILNKWTELNDWVAAVLELD